VDDILVRGKLQLMEEDSTQVMTGDGP